jgi:NADH dehydrogenase
MHILIIGALGDVGSAATKYAVAKGHRVTAFDLSKANTATFGEARDKVAFFEGDVMDTASLLPAMEGVNAVITTIRLTTEQMLKGRSYKDVEFQGIKNVVDVARAQGVRKFVHLSVDGLCLGCEMCQAKSQAEEVIRNSGMDYTIFRSSALFKEFDSFFIPQVLKTGNGATDWLYGPIDIRHCPLSHLDLAQCMVLAADNPKASNKIIPIGGPDCITLSDLLHMIAKEAGFKAHFTSSVSKEVLLQSIQNNLRQSLFTARQIQDFMLDSTIDHAAIRDMFGVEFQRMGDYIRQAVPRVRAAMAGRQKSATPSPLSL